MGGVSCGVQHFVCVARNVHRYAHRKNNQLKRARSHRLTIGAQRARGRTARVVVHLVPQRIASLLKPEVLAMAASIACRSSHLRKWRERQWVATPHRPREDGLTHPADTCQDVILLPWVCFRRGGFQLNPRQHRRPDAKGSELWRRWKSFDRHTLQLPWCGAS